ncbi:hypothetical protein M5E86_22630 [Blautia wexlerae]|nr:hypothetical protein M5E86_22630 [Blautia wexlerae]
MKNKEFWKGAVAGALVVTCIGTGAFAGTGLANQKEQLLVIASVHQSWHILKS